MLRVTTHVLNRIEENRSEPAGASIGGLTRAVLSEQNRGQ
jgi:hypothetical protein